MIMAALALASFPQVIMLHKASQCYGELTAAYGQSKASGHNVESGSY